MALFQADPATHHECCAGALVFDRRCRILMIQDRWGNYGVPKGQYERTDPSALACARREVREETGVEFALAHAAELAYEEDRIRRRYAPRGRVRKHVTLFVGRRVEDGGDVRAQTSEVDAAMFVPVDKFYEVVTNKSLVSAVELAVRLLVGDLAGE